MALTLGRLKKGAARLVATLTAFSLGACAIEPPAVAKEPRPALWKLADDDTTIYLFGTIHVLPKDLAWRTPLIDKAIRESDELVLETAGGIDLEATAKVMQAMARSPGLPPLLDRLPEDKRPALAQTLSEVGVPHQALDGVETWAAAMMLTALSLRRLGYVAETGVERGLAADYGGATGKPISGLETVEQQFGFFDSLPEDAQRLFLAASIEDPVRARAQFEAMLKAWTAGDTDAIARTFDSETALSAELREVLMTRRNAAWADWLEKRLEKPGTVLVAVGAGHLAGQDSVQKMLEARGLKTVRLQ